MSLVTRVVWRCSAAAASPLRSTTLLPSASFLFQNPPTLNPSLSSSCRPSACPPATISPLFSLPNQRDCFPAAPPSRCFSSGDHLRQVVQKNASPVEYVQASSAPAAPAVLRPPHTSVFLCCQRELGGILKPPPSKFLRSIISRYTLCVRRPCNAAGSRAPPDSLWAATALSGCFPAPLCNQTLKTCTLRPHPAFSRALLNV